MNTEDANIRVKLKLGEFANKVVEDPNTRACLAVAVCDDGLHVLTAGSERDVLFARVYLTRQGLDSRWARLRLGFGLLFSIFF